MAKINFKTISIHEHVYTEFVSSLDLGVEKLRARAEEALLTWVQKRKKEELLAAKNGDQS